MPEHYRSPGSPTGTFIGRADKCIKDPDAYSPSADKTTGQDFGDSTTCTRTSAGCSKTGDNPGKQQQRAQIPRKCAQTCTEEPDPVPRGAAFVKSSRAQTRTPHLRGRRNLARRLQEARIVNGNVSRARKDVRRVTRHEFSKGSTSQDPQSASPFPSAPQTRGRRRRTYGL